MGHCKGRITKIEKSETTSCTLTQGIKGHEQYKYDNSDKYNGSNGSYTSNYRTEYSVDLYLTVYGEEPGNDKRIKIDIRDDILQKNNLKRISQKRMDEVIKNNVGKKVSFIMKDDKIIFDEEQLIL